MAQERRKLQKRKEREDKAKKAKLYRAKEAAAKRQEEKAKLQTLEAKKKIMKEEARLRAMAEAIYDKLPEETRKKLEHNIQILRALEEEHAKEQAEKAKLNSELEGQGAEDLQSKMSLLTKAANAVGSVGGEAEYSFKVNEPVVEEIPEQA
jgi:hypothetical protein